MNDATGGKAGTESRLAHQVRAGLGLTRYALRATFRNKASYFFSLIFPLTLVLVFMRIAYISLPLGAGPFRDLSIALMRAIGVT